MCACTCVVTKRMNLDSKRNQVKLKVTKEGKREGLHESRKGRGREIMYDQLVKHGCIICREIKVSQKNVQQRFLMQSTKHA